MNKATFALRNYTFERVIMDLKGRNENSELNIKFEPSGIFSVEKKEFELNFVFKTIDEEKDREIINIDCYAIFSFTNVESISDIPEYFYTNSIAIVFPFIRAFVSTLTLQANMSPLLLPILNLSSLKDILKENTQEA